MKFQKNKYNCCTSVISQKKWRILRCWWQASYIQNRGCIFIKVCKLNLSVFFSEWTHNFCLGRYSAAFVITNFFSVDAWQFFTANNFYKRSWWLLLVLKFLLRLLRWASGNWTNSASFASCGLLAFLVGSFKIHTKGQKCFCFYKQFSVDSMAVCFFRLQLTLHTWH